MFSVKGPGIKIVASIIALAALAFGIYSTFFQSAGYETTTATIIKIEVDENYVPDPDTENDEQYIATVEYTVNGTRYERTLDSYSPSYKVGGTVEIKYDPKDPSKITSGFGFGIYLMIAGGVILLIVIFATIKKRASVKKLKEMNGKDLTFTPSEKGEERMLYFITDLGTAKVGHRIEDKNRNVLYEAKMTKFTVTTPFGFDFIDHEHGKTTPHLIGHAEETDWNMLLIDNNYTISFDGKDVWKQLRKLGVSLDARFGEAKGVMPSYTIRKDGEEIAFAETTSQYVHEEDEEKHKIAGKVPVQGFYRVHTREKNLDLLFTILVAMARSGATDERGGTRRMLFNTIADK